MWVWESIECVSDVRASCLESIFRKINLKTKELNNGEYLNHLRFADDIILMSKTAEELQDMLNDLNRESLNRSKTKVMSNSKAQNAKIKIKMRILKKHKVERWDCEICRKHMTKNGTVQKDMENIWEAFVQQWT
nr:uncharacterized protein LOC113825513 [Penaeus vannamei]